ncbi:NUDIX domain-containing protein [Devosia sp.]|uniref:NUDIX domain-containing protein n=1 Tax=Devosia sp. TaxID=1871048 RepID=UPI003A8D87CF
MSRWQIFRTWLHMLVVGLRRRIVLGARVALLDGNRVLLLRHTYLPGWHFPGGGVEPGEAAVEAVMRELREETGHEALETPQLHGFFHNVNPATTRDHVALFVCRRFREIHSFQRNLEIAEIGWFALDALPEGIEPGTAARLIEIREGRAPTTRW